MKQFAAIRSGELGHFSALFQYGITGRAGERSPNRLSFSQL